MSREGNSESVFRFADFDRTQLVHGKGTWALVVGLALATAYSCSTDSDANNSSFNIFRKPYLNIENCLTNSLALDGLSAECQARDGTKWHIQQTAAIVSPSEFALGETIPEALAKSQQKDTTLAWVAFNTPLVLTPEGDTQCETDCVIVGERADTTVEYYVVTDPRTKTNINDNLIKTGIEPGLAIITDKNSSSY